MSRRTTRAAAEAAAAEAGQAAVASKTPETKLEAPVEEERSETTAPDMMEKLLKARPSVHARDEILAKRGLLDDEKEEPEEEPKAKTVAVEKPAEQTAETVEATTEEKPEPKTTKQTVDGVEYDVAETELEEAGGARAWRIARANENRLKKTNEALEETRKLQAQMSEILNKQPKVEKKPELSDVEYIAERMEKWRFGTPQEAAQAQIEITQRLNKQPDPQEIESRVTTKIAHDAAVKRFDIEFADLAKNPILLDAVIAQRNRKLAQRQANGDSSAIDFDVFYRTIGNEVRSAFGKQSQPATKTDETSGTPSEKSEKEARKASIVTIPKAAARAELPKEEKEPTPEEFRRQAIADMKKARGQG